MFVLQIFFPTIIDPLFESQNGQFLLYKFCYWVLSSGVTLGIVAECLNIIRNNNSSLNHLVNYFHKIPINLMCSITMSMIFIVLAILLLMLFGDSNSLNFSSIYDFKNSIVDSKLLFGVIAYIIIITYLSIKCHFFVYFIIDKDLGAINALKSSLVVTNGYEADLFIIWTIIIGINFIGILFFGLGLLFSLPFSMLVLSLLYDSYFKNG